MTLSSWQKRGQSSERKTKRKSAKIGGEKTERKEIKNEVRSKNERMCDAKREVERELCIKSENSLRILNDYLHGIEERTRRLFFTV